MRCRHFGVCGGCQSQDVPYAAQLTTKHLRLVEMLRSLVDPSVIAPVRGMPVGEDGSPWAFRQKAAFAFARGPGGRLLMGHYGRPVDGARRGARAARHGPVVVPISECPVHTSRANALAFRLAGHLAAADIPAAGPDRTGVLRHLIVRTTRDEREAVVLLVVARNDKRLRRPVRAFLDGPDAPGGLLLNVNDRPGPYMVVGPTLPIAGARHVAETSLGPTFLVSPAAFFQTNVTAAGVLVEEVRAALGRPVGRVLDLYSGSGLFALHLAIDGWRVTAVEENRQAVEDAERNLRVNHVPPGRVRRIGMRVEAAVDRLSMDVDAVVLDPPRQGCPPEVIDAVFGWGRPARAVYVSCNPASLAAELPEIMSRGYAVSRVVPVDMFPHTDHLEVVAVLERRTAGARAPADGSRRRKNPGRSGRTAR